jgi:hypothetical protein
MVGENYYLECSMSILMPFFVKLAAEHLHSGG